jgi:hypothetical protein
MPGWVDRYAPYGKIWVCSACGKTSQDLYPTAEQMLWDDSCMRHAVLSDEGRVREVEPPRSRWAPWATSLSLTPRASV